MHRIFLIGFMGSGKSTLGNELAKELDFTFIETDIWIEQQEGKSISDIFSQSGEGFFRKKETEFLLHLQLVNNCVIATGGGMPCSETNIKMMNQLGITIWLDVDENILMDRLGNESQNRPLLANEDNLLASIRSLLQIRKPFYQQAQYIIKNPTIDQLRTKIANPKS